MEFRSAFEIRRSMWENDNVNNWHKAEIRRSGTFRESCGAINLQHVVRSGCNVVVN